LKRRKSWISIREEEGGTAANVLRVEGGGGRGSSH